LLNRIAIVVANVLRSMFVAGVGGFSHQDAKVSRGNGPVRELQRDRSALGLLQDACGKDSPVTFPSSVEIERVCTTPVFHLVGHGIGAGPLDPESTERLLGL